MQIGSGYSLGLFGTGSRRAGGAVARLARRVGRVRGYLSRELVGDITPPRRKRLAVPAAVPERTRRPLARLASIDRKSSDAFWIKASRPRRPSPSSLCQSPASAVLHVPRGIRRSTTWLLAQRSHLPRSLDVLSVPRCPSLRPEPHTHLAPQSGSTSWPVASVQPFNTLPLSKYEPCSSPSLSSTSRSASVSTLGPPSPHSVCSDDPANTTKRARASPTPHPSRVGRSLSPQSSTRLESSQTKQARAKYRSIRPAPANTSEPSSKVPASHMPRLPRQSPPEPSHRSRHPISEPSTPYPRGTPFNFTPHSSWAAEANGPFLHTPTDLPPQRYARGLDSPFRPEKLEGTIPGSMLDMVRSLVRLAFCFRLLNVFLYSRFLPSKLASTVSKTPLLNMPSHESIEHSEIPLLRALNRRTRDPTCRCFLCSQIHADTSLLTFCCLPRTTQSSQKPNADFLLIS
jgi:hypothetical protein